MDKNRKLTKQEVAAMWLHGDDYARRGIGAIAYYKLLSEFKKNNIDRMLREIKEATNES